MKLRLIQGNFTVARYAPDAPLTGLYTREFCSITRTKNEVTVVCESDLVPPGMQKKEEGWVCLEVEGDWDFSLSKILDKISGTEISLFAVSTYDSDFVLVKRGFLERVRPVLQAAGITF